MALYPTYYEKPTINGTDTTLILQPRQGVIIPFEELGQNWTIARLGLMVSWTNSSSYNTSGSVQFPTFTGETMLNDYAVNRFFIGLKNNNTVLPGFAGSYFMGWGGRVGASDTISTYNNFHHFNINNETVGTIINGTASVTTKGYATFGLPGYSSADTSNYCIAWTIYFYLNDIGTSTQSVTIKRNCCSPYFSSSDDNTLFSYMTKNGPTPDVFTHPWNFAASPLARPTCVFLRLPFYYTRLRVHSLSIEAFE